MMPIQPEEMEARLALRAMAHKRFPLAVLWILGFLAIALPIELFYFPDRGNVYLLILGVQLGGSAIALSLSRVWPDRVLSFVTGWAAGIAALVVLYYPLVSADATVAMAALVCLVAATPVMLPLSLRHHLVVCATSWLGLVALYSLGVPSSLAWPYLFLTFFAVSSLSSAGVRSLDEARQEAVQREAALRRVEEELRAALGRAESVVEQRSRLIADVSHEVRTPVNVILGYADMLLDESTGPEGRAELAQRIREYGVSLDALVTRLLDLSRLQSGRCGVANEPVALEPLLDELASGARLLVRGKPIRVEVACAGTSIETDGLRLRQILRNLVTNAVRATDEGVISIGVQRQGDWCRFTVADTGCGIEKDRQEQIFAAFEQVEGGAGGGIGLGLAIVRQLADVLGGRVTVQSVLGSGSAFSVELPLEPEPAGEGAGAAA